MNEKIEKLESFINNLSRFEIAEEIDGNYKNMGATIIDGILQAGINYKTTVKPRVLNFLSKYPHIKTVSEFKELCDRHSISKIINWKKSAKTERIEKLTEFLINQSVETEDEFKCWLNKKSNIDALKKLPGIKDKTADYFKILTGHNTNAVDRHLIGFLEKAGITVTSYKEAQDIISQVATKLGIEESYLDHSIWKYMSESTQEGR